ncbi:hypothetical protein [Haloferula sp.]|uniref:hypothetical protein n=1 Tax=Haloferula sp. TaxID=2497595 RepID=UPI00329CECA7
MKRKVGIATLTFILLAPFSEARSWTDVEGRVIEADYVSSDEENVIILKGEKEFTLPLERLSEADRTWVKEQSEGGGEMDGDKAAEPKKEAAKNGLIDELPVTVLFRTSPEEWAAGKAAEKCSEDEHFSKPLNTNFANGFDACVSAPDQRCMVYVPEGYDGSEAYGVYLHINPGGNASIPSEYHPIFDERKIIAVSAFSTSNMHAHWERVARSMNALATVRSKWKTDPNRTFVGGFSGGGHMAFLTQALFSNEFRGAISHAAQSYPPGPDGGTGGHFGPMSADDFSDGRRAQNYWLIIIGTDDKRNYAETQKTAEDWEALPVEYRCDEVEGHGHKVAPVDAFAKGLEWLESNPENAKKSKRKD